MLIWNESGKQEHECPSWTTETDVVNVKIMHSNASGGWWYICSCKKNLGPFKVLEKAKKEAERHLKFHGH